MKREIVMSARINGYVRVNKWIEHIDEMDKRIAENIDFNRIKQDIAVREIGKVRVG